MKYCEKCGNQLFDEAVMCPKCGCTVGKDPSVQKQDETAKSQAVGAICILAAVALIIVVVLLAISQY